MIYYVFYRLVQQQLGSFRAQSCKAKKMMKRYFYSGNRITKNLIETHFNLVRMEDQVYRDALLAALKLQPNKLQNFKSLRETILDMTIIEQAQYARNYQLEQLFRHFDTLHRNSRGRQMMVKGRQSLSKDLVDPDKFPVWDLKRKPNVFYSIWNTILGKIRYDTGFQLLVRNSLIEHPEGGRGVFVNLAANKKEIQIGDFLGLVPGSIYQSYEDYKKIKLDKMKSYERLPQHLHFPSGRVLELGQYQYYDHFSKTQVEIEPFMVNPYSLGQFINHPPYDQTPNVIFTQIEIPLNFFPSYLKKYLPYNTHLNKKIKLKEDIQVIIGIFARRAIKNNEELYVDYCENHIYPIDNVPEWMCEPDYEQYKNEVNLHCLNLNKEQYENPSPLYWDLVEKQALKEKQKLYESYLKTVKYRPKRILYEDEEVKISSMKAGPDTKSNSNL